MLFLSTGFFLKDESSGAGKPVDEFESALCAQYTDRGCQRVGGSGRSRHDAHLNSIGQTEAGVGIDDVRITHAPNLNKLFGVARSRNARISQENCATDLVISNIDIGDSDSPTGFAWWWIAGSEVAARRDKRTVEAARLQ